MPRQIREFVNIDFFGPLKARDVLAKLQDILEECPDLDAEIRLQGDDMVGRRLQILYWRDPTEEELGVDRKYGT